jgi:hypothetical protein
VSAAGDFLPAGFHCLEVAGPGEGIAGDGRPRGEVELRISAEVVVPGHLTVRPEKKPGHVGVEGMPGAVVVDLAVYVPGKRAAPRRKLHRLPIDFVPRVNRPAEPVSIGEPRSIGVLHQEIVAGSLRVGQVSRRRPLLRRSEMELVRQQPQVHRDRPVLRLALPQRGEADAILHRLKRPFASVVRMIGLQRGVTDLGTRESGRCDQEQRNRDEKSVTHGLVITNLPRDSPNRIFSHSRLERYPRRCFTRQVCV